MTSEVRRYAGSTAAERDLQRRKRLHEACVELVGTQGYAATTITALCRRAGVSTRHFYELYPGKEDLFLEVYGERVAQSFAHAAAQLAATEGLPLKERIGPAFSAYFRPMVASVPVARLMFVEVMGVSDRVEQTRLGYRESLVEIITAEGVQAAERGEVTPRDFRVAALALAGAASAVAYDWALRSDGGSAAEVESEMTRLALRILTA